MTGGPVVTLHQLGNLRPKRLIAVGATEQVALRIRGELQTAVRTRFALSRRWYRDAFNGSVLSTCVGECLHLNQQRRQRRRIIEGDSEACDAIATHVHLAAGAIGTQLGKMHRGLWRRTQLTSSGHAAQGTWRPAGNKPTDKT